MRHVIPISGKDSLACALIQTVRQPDVPYEFFFNDTGCELPETYDWLDRVERTTGWKLNRIGKSLEAIIHAEDMLPSSQVRFGDHYCDELPEWKSRQLFSGRTRANCFFCFFQRQYEILWLAETHPDLLWRTSWLERTTGKRRSGPYSFR